MTNKPKGPQGANRRSFRQALDTCIPIVGVLTILGAVASRPDIRIQLAIVVVGIILVEAGVWKLSQWILPNERQYVALRSEGDHFITLLRQLNDAALRVKDLDTPQNQQAFEDVRQAMHQSVDRMAEVAGETHHEADMKEAVTI